MLLPLKTAPILNSRFTIIPLVKVLTIAFLFSMPISVSVFSTISCVYTTIFLTKFCRNEEMLSNMYATFDKGVPSFPLGNVAPKRK